MIAFNLVLLFRPREFLELKYRLTSACVYTLKRIEGLTIVVAVIKFSILLHCFGYHYRSFNLMLRVYMNVQSSGNPIPVLSIEN